MEKSSVFSQNLKVEILNLVGSYAVLEKKQKYNSNYLSKWNSKNICFKNPV